MSWTDDPPPFPGASLDAWLTAPPDEESMCPCTDERADRCECVPRGEICTCECHTSTALAHVDEEGMPF